VTPGVEEAWIAVIGAAGGGVVGVVGTLLGGVLSSRSTNAQIAANSADVGRQIDANSADIAKQVQASIAGINAQIAASAATVSAQIEADRRSRIWEKKAAAYTDAIAMIMHRQDVRQGMWHSMITGTEPDRPASPVDARKVEAELITYASDEVMDATREAGKAGQEFELAVSIWNSENQQIRDLAASRIPASGLPSQSQPGRTRDDAERKLRDANHLDDTLIDAIRHELHASTTVPPTPPAPRASPEASAEASAPRP